MPKLSWGAAGPTNIAPPAPARTSLCSMLCSSPPHSSAHEASTPSATKILLLEDMPPEAIPIGPGNVGHAAVGIEEFVRRLKHGEHQAALGCPGHVSAAWLAPDEFARPNAKAFGGPLLIYKLALEHVGLLDLDVFVVG